jgi:hypothetical protein
MRTLDLRPCISLGRQSNKIRLPLALSKLPKQGIFQKVEQLGRVLADIEGVQNVPKDCLGKLARALAYLSF